MAISIQQSWELSGEDFKTRGNELIGWVYFRWVVSQSFSRNHLEWCCPSSGGAAGQTDKGCDPHWAHLSSLSPTEGTESLQITIFSFKWVFLLGRKSLLSFVLASSFIKKKKMQADGSMCESITKAVLHLQKTLFQTSDHPFFGNI